MTIGSFPTPLPDELLYSVCARYGVRMGYGNIEAINAELFGARGISAAIDLPSHLGYLAANLPTGHSLTADRLIDRYTLLPAFAPFLTIDRARRLRRDMSGSSGLAIHKTAGITPASIRGADWLRYCPSCVRDDRKTFGQCYWHRIHQLTGVEVCHKHKLHLENSGVRARNRINSACYITAEEADLSFHSRSLSPGDPSHRILLNISSDFSWLLNQPNFTPGFMALHTAYKYVLRQKNLVRPDGRLNSNNLIMAIRAFYPTDLLKVLQCDFDDDKNYSWPFRLLKELKFGKANHPIRHLLLAQLCGYTAERFFNLCDGIERTIAPKPSKVAVTCDSVALFGRGPWPCLNPTCSDYHIKVITSCRIKKHLSLRPRQVGVFACRCGFSYSRKGLDSGGDDYLKYDQVETRGRVWEDALRRFWADSNRSVRSISESLGTAHNTVKQHAIRLKLKFPRKGPNGALMKKTVPQLAAKRKSRRTRVTQNRVRHDYAELRADHRQKWLALLKSNPFANLTQLKALGKSIHRWLKTHDSDWLTANSPAPRRRGATRTVDWASRDAFMAQEVVTAGTELRKSEGRPIQVSRQMIGRRLDKGQLLSKRCLARLPLTRAALSTAVETRVEYYTRRLYWAAKYFSEQKVIPAFSTLGLKSGLHWKYWYLPEIKSVFETVINSLEIEAEDIRSAKAV